MNVGSYGSRIQDHFLSWHMSGTELMPEYVYQKRRAAPPFLFYEDPLAPPPGTTRVKAWKGVLNKSACDNSAALNLQQKGLQFRCPWHCQLFSHGFPCVGNAAVSHRLSLTTPSSLGVTCVVAGVSTAWRVCVSVCLSVYVCVCAGLLRHWLAEAGAAARWRPVRQFGRWPAGAPVLQVGIPDGRAAHRSGPAQLLPRSHLHAQRGGRPRLHLDPGRPPLQTALPASQVSEPHTLRQNRWHSIS